MTCALGRVLGWILRAFGKTLRECFVWKIGKELQCPNCYQHIVGKMVNLMRCYCLVNFCHGTPANTLRLMN